MRKRNGCWSDCGRHIPDLVLRTTLITGFPGETAEQFAELLEFVAQQRFERLGVFEYSLEADTPAAALPDPVDAADPSVSDANN